MPATPPRPPRPPARRGPYRLGERIGGGGTAVVVRGVDTRDGRAVALKILSVALADDPAARERLRREAAVARAVDHPNVGAVEELLESADDGPCLVMPLHPGRTLAQRLAAAGALPVGEAVGLGCQLLCGLAALHAAGFVHRDVAPGNLLVTPRGELLILDLGLAAPPGTDDGLRGAAATSAPEVLRGTPADARADLWSAGVVLYEMLAGGPPFGGAGAAAVVRAVAHEPPRPLAERRDGVPAELAAVVMRALEKRPARRWATAGDFLAALEDAHPGTDASRAVAATPVEEG